jgi:hypothetical protein
MRWLARLAAEWLSPALLLLLLLPAPLLLLPAAPLLSPAAFAAPVASGCELA